MLTPETIIDGRFEVVSVLGEGGMGIVYSVRHAEMERTVALKMLRASLAHEPDKIARFRNEAKALSSLNHRNIIQVHSIGVTASGQPYIVMEELNGESLADIIKKRGPLSYQEALPLFIDVCNGVNYAHQYGIIHRDIKPSNLIVIDDNGKPLVKIVDFGIAKILGSDQALTQPGTLLGSVHYLSPELIEGKPADRISDNYALGCTLYELLSGQPPFAGDNIYETVQLQQQSAPPAVNAVFPGAHIPDTLEQVLHRAMARDPGQRYQTAEQLTSDLSSMIAGHGSVEQKSLFSGRSVLLKKVNTGKMHLGLAATCLIAMAVLNFGAHSKLPPPVDAVSSGRELQMRAMRDVSEQKNAEAGQLVDQAMLILKDHPREQAEALFLRGAIYNRQSDHTVKEQTTLRTAALTCFRRSAAAAESALNQHLEYSAERQVKIRRLEALKATAAEQVEMLHQDIPNAEIDQLYALYRTDRSIFSSDLVAGLIRLLGRTTFLRLYQSTSPDSALYAVHVRAKIMQAESDWKGQLRDDEEAYCSAFLQRYGKGAEASCHKAYAPN